MYLCHTITVQPVICQSCIAYPSGLLRRPNDPALPQTNKTKTSNPPCNKLTNTYTADT